MDFSLLHPSHWFHTHKHHECLFPFDVFATEIYNGKHKNHEISFKKGDIIQVSGQCNADGTDPIDVPRTSTRMSNGIMNTNYPVYPGTESGKYWIGRLMKYTPDGDHYPAHDIGHFPVEKVMLQADYSAFITSGKDIRTKGSSETKNIAEEEEAEEAERKAKAEEEAAAKAKSEEEKEAAAKAKAEKEAAAKAKAEKEAAAKAKAEKEAAAKAKAEEEAAAKAKAEQAQKELDDQARKAQEELDRLEAEEEAERKGEDEIPEEEDESETAHDHAYVATHRQRTLEQAGAGKSRVRQRVLYAPSKELHKKSCLRRLQLPPTIPPTPIILIIGDLASLDDDQQERQLDNFRLGILRAAASHDALIVDSGLASGMACAAPTDEYADYCKKVCSLGISPNKIEDPLSQYHTHQLIISDYNRWNDRQDEFVKHKLAMVRRLAGSCRVVCVLVNNGHTAWSEALEASKFGWPIVLVQGSGDLANEIIYAKMTGQCYDFNIRQIVNDGNTCVLNSDCSEAELYSLIALNLTYDVQGIKKQIAYMPKKVEGNKKLKRAL